ncbi:MAG: hypothetical protein J2P54_18865 [Bradyrhizobiaceae bacterium]|nr:hypothetical protein [Bradyrhizobiaceae bacterium]
MNARTLLLIAVVVVGVTFRVAIVYMAYEPPPPPGYAVLILYTTQPPPAAPYSSSFGDAPRPPGNILIMRDGAPSPPRPDSPTFFYGGTMWRQRAQQQ